jgi:hypothetical protein
MSEPRLSADFVNEADRAPDDDALRMLAEVLDLRGEPLRQGDVIGVHAGEKFTSRTAEHFVQRDQITGVRPAHDANPRVGGRVLLEDDQRAIGRSVVDD